MTAFVGVENIKLNIHFSRIAIAWTNVTNISDQHLADKHMADQNLADSKIGRLSFRRKKTWPTKNEMNSFRKISTVYKSKIRLQKKKISLVVYFTQILVSAMVRRYSTLLSSENFSIIFLNFTLRSLLHIFSPSCLDSVEGSICLSNIAKTRLFQYLAFNLRSLQLACTLEPFNDCVNYRAVIIDCGILNF